MANSNLQDEQSERNPQQVRHGFGNFEPTEPVIDRPANRADVARSVPLEPINPSGGAAAASGESTEGSAGGTAAGSAQASGAGAVAGPPPKPQPSLGGRVGRGVGGFARKHWKGLGAGGIGTIAIGGAIVGILFLIPLKLIHIRQNLSNFFDRRQQHMISNSIPKGYDYAFNKDQVIDHYKRNDPSHPIRNAIWNTQTSRLINDLHTKGIDARIGQGFNYPDPKLRGAKGQLLGFDTPTGFVDGGTLSDRRSFVRTTLAEEYPEMGFFHRSLRARRLYEAYGIKWKFLENTREKVNAKEQEIVSNLREKIRQAVFNSEPPPVTTTGKSDNQDKNQNAQEQQQIDQAAQNLDSNIKGQVDQIRASANDGSITVPEPNPAPAAAEAVAKGGLSGFFSGIITTLNGFCTIDSMLNIVSETARIARMAPLMRWVAEVMFSSADQQMAGKVVDTKQLSALNGLLGNSKSDFSQSGAWKNYIEGDKNARPKPDNVNLVGINVGLTGTLADMKSTVDGTVNKYGGAVGCKIVGNTLVQVGGAVGSAVVGFFTGGSTKIAETSIGLAEGALFGLAQNYAEPIIARNVAGAVITGNEAPDVLGDAMVAGAEVLANQNTANNGGRSLSDNEVNQLALESAVADQQDPAKQTLSYRLFNLDNPTSVASRMLDNVPTSGAQVRTQLASLVSLFDLTNWHSKLQLAGSAVHVAMTPAYAAEASYPNFFKSPQKGLTDADFAKAGDALQNEDAIFSNPTVAQDYQRYIDKCVDSAANGSDGSGQSYDANAVNDDASECNDNSDTHVRYRVEYFNAGVQTMIQSYSNDNDDQALGSSTSIDLSSLPIPNIGNAKILKAALKYRGAAYSLADRTLPSIFSARWAAGDHSLTIDCSLLTSLAAYDAYGLNKLYCSADYLHDPANWAQIPLNQVQPGDLVVRGDTCGSSGHVAIVAAFDVNSNQVTVFDASNPSVPADFRKPRPIQRSPQNQYGFDHAVRYIGPGAGGQ